MGPRQLPDLAWELACLDVCQLDWPSPRVWF